MKDTAGVAIVQPAPDSPDIIVVSSVENPTAVEGLSIVNPAALNTPPSRFFFSFLFKFFFPFFCRIICQTVINAPFFWGFYEKTFTRLGYICYFYPLPILIFCLHFNRV